MQYVLGIDQSTSATKALLFDSAGRVIDKASVNHRQHYPKPGWVEHDAQEIYTNTLSAAGELLGRNPLKTGQLLCVSITNQRETIAVFETKTGRPVRQAIVWQDRRGDDLCRRLTDQGHEQTIRAKTGLKIDSYFSASKIKWMMDNDPQTAEALRGGEARLGTIDAYLIYRLTGGQSFATDHTNACRTLLYDIYNRAWDQQLCEMFSVPPPALPKVLPCDAVFGRTDLAGLLAEAVPICGVMGDSQAALFAQRCFEPGSTKVTFGTGSSVLVNAGPKPPTKNLGGIVATIGWVLGEGPTYALEGIINSTGATIAWLKDQLGLIDAPAQSEELARSVEDNGGVYFVPAFGGMGAPYWNQQARAAIVGLSQHSDRRHVARAALESIAYQVRDVLDSIITQAGVPLTVIHADGGMVSNTLLMQFVADIVKLPLKASKVPELSALGAVLAGLGGSGFYKSISDLKRLEMDATSYLPAMPDQLRDRFYEGWKRAVQRVL